LTTPKLVEHFFRHEYGRLVATLSHRVGVQYIEDVEDAVQSALMTALETWTITDLPDNPSAWLFRVAHNNVMGELRRRTGRRRILEQNVKGDIGTLENGPEIFLAGEVRDDLLRMLFVCCDEAIPVESRLVLALKTLCGFEIREIALAVLIGFEPPTWLAGSYIWAAVLADLHRRCGDAHTANCYRDVACKSAPTPAVKELL
jgi:predicted RNA polymerase sigma factor